MTMQARYLQRWSKAIHGIEDFAVEEWARRLSGLSPEEVKHGLESWDEEWPPNVEQFRKCCLSHKDWRETATGIVEKAQELGVDWEADEPFPHFRDRVLAAAGEK